MAAVAELTRLLQKVKAQGKTIIVAEHRLWYLMEVADRVIYMESGRVARDMATSEFRALTEQGDLRLEPSLPRFSADRSDRNAHK